MERILVATDGSDTARRAEATARELAVGQGASLLLVHAVIDEPTDADLTGMAGVMRDLGPQRTASLHVENVAKHVAQSTGQEGIYTQADALRALGERVLEQAADRAREAGVARVETHLNFGDAGHVIVEAARNYGVDLIVVGTRGYGGLRGRLMGSVSQSVMHKAPQSTLVVKDEADAG